MSLDLEALAVGSAPVECIEFVQGTSAWRYTSADQPQMVHGSIYVPREISTDPVQDSQEADSGTLRITLLETDPVCRLFIGYLPPEPVAVRRFFGERGDTSPALTFSGEAESPEFNGQGLAVITCVGLGGLLELEIPGMVYQTPCNHVLFGDGCGLDADDWQDAGRVAGIAGARLIVTTAVTREDGYYARGQILNAAGERRRILGQSGNTLTLIAPFRTLSLGERVSLWPGCDRSEAMCRDRFGNLINHFGFGRMPKNNPFLTRYH